MTDFYEKLGYSIISLAMVAVIYSNAGDLMISISENFGFHVYLVYCVAIVVCWGILKYIGKFLKWLFISSKPKVKTEKQIQKEMRKEEKYRRIHSRSFENTRLGFFYSRAFHAIISLAITAIVYTYYGEVIIRLSEIIDKPTSLFYMLIVAGVFGIVRYALRPIIWLVAGNKESW